MPVIEHYGTSYKFEDAGPSGHSNPSMIAVFEAEKLFIGKSRNTLVSIGTGLQSLVQPNAREMSREERIAYQLQAVANDTERVHDAVDRLLHGYVARSGPVSVR